MPNGSQNPNRGTGERLQDLTFAIRADTSELIRDLDFSETSLRTYLLRQAGNLAVSFASLAADPIRISQDNLDRLRDRAVEGFQSITTAAVTTFGAIAVASGTAVASQIGNIRDLDRQWLALAGSISLSLEDARSEYNAVVQTLIRDTGAAETAVLGAVEKVVSAGFRDPAVVAQLAYRGLIAEQAGLVRRSEDLIRSSTTLAAAMYGTAAAAGDVDQATNIIIRTAQLADTAVREMAPAFLTIIPIMSLYGTQVNDIAVLQGLLSRSFRSAFDASNRVFGLFRSIGSQAGTESITRVAGITERDLDTLLRTEGGIFRLFELVEAGRARLGAGIGDVFASSFDQQTYSAILNSLTEVEGAYAHLQIQQNALVQSAKDLDGTLLNVSNTISSRFTSTFARNANIILGQLGVQEVKSLGGAAETAAHFLSALVGSLVKFRDEIARLAVGTALAFAFYKSLTLIHTALAAVLFLAGTFVNIFYSLGSVAVVTALILSRFGRILIAGLYRGLRLVFSALLAVHGAIKALALSVSWKILIAAAGSLTRGLQYLYFVLQQLTFEWGNAENTTRDFELGWERLTLKIEQSAISIEKTWLRIRRSILSALPETPGLVGQLRLIESQLRELDRTQLLNQTRIDAISNLQPVLRGDIGREESFDLFLGEQRELMEQFTRSLGVGLTGNDVYGPIQTDIEALRQELADAVSFDGVSRAVGTAGADLTVLEVATTERLQEISVQLQRLPSESAKRLGRELQFQVLNLGETSIDQEAHRNQIEILRGLVEEAGGSEELQAVQQLSQAAERLGILPDALLKAVTSQDVNLPGSIPDDLARFSPEAASLLSEFKDELGRLSTVVDARFDLAGGEVEESGLANLRRTLERIATGLDSRFEIMTRSLQEAFTAPPGEQLKTLIGFLPNFLEGPLKDFFQELLKAEDEIRKQVEELGLDLNREGGEGEGGETPLQTLNRAQTDAARNLAEGISGSVVNNLTSLRKAGEGIVDTVRGTILTQLQQNLARPLERAISNLFAQIVNNAYGDALGGLFDRFFGGGTSLPGTGAGGGAGGSAGQFHSGGIIPGPPGRDVTARVRTGEVITPATAEIGGNITIPLQAVGNVDEAVQRSWFRNANTFAGMVYEILVKNRQISAGRR